VKPTLGVELAERLRRQVEAKTPQTGAEVFSVAREEYVSRERLDADKAMFRRVAHVIGWAGEVASPGTYITRDVMGVPVLVTRAQDGRLHAFINGCLHRGAAVAQGCGAARKFVCPYHAWSYDLDGRLIGVPDRSMFDGVDLKSRGLRPLPVSERAGLISVGLSPGVDVDDHLREVEGPLVDHEFATRSYYATRRFDLKTNWKLAVSVNFEGYHFKVLHRKTVDRIATNNSIYEVFGPHALWVFPFRQLDLSEKAPAWPFDFQATAVYFLFPSCILIEAPGVTLMLRVYPGDGPGDCAVYMESGSIRPILTDADRAACEAALSGTAAILDAEDFPQAESCQKGLEAGVPDVIFGRSEPVLHHLARQWAQKSR